MFFHYLGTDKWDPMVFFRTGGMPSSHTASVTSMTAAIYFLEGPSNLFMVSLIVSSIVIEKMVLKRTKGIVVNISSISAQGNAGQTAYSAAKAGVEALTKTWAKELGIFGIRVVAIAPGFMDTESTHKALNEKIINALKQKVPLKTLGNAKDVSEAIVYAIESEYVNGAVLKIDGGLTL